MKEKVWTRFHLAKFETSVLRDKNKMPGLHVNYICSGFVTFSTTLKILLFAISKLKKRGEKPHYGF